MKNTLETRLGIFVALAVIAAVLLLETVGGPDLFRPGYRLRALFNNVQELKKGDRVKMAGVEVGRVEDITLDEKNDKVLVIMKLRRGVQVKTDSVATIKFTGLMGQNFVSIDFGSATAPRAEPGALLSSDEQPELSDMMKRIDNVAKGVEKLTDSFTGINLDQLLGPLRDFVKANKDPLTITISNMQAVSTQIRSGEGTVGKLIYDESPTNLYNTALGAVTNLQGTADEVKLTVAEARKVVEQINSGQGTVGKLIYDDAVYNSVRSAGTNLDEILQKINHGQGTVSKLINDQEFYKNAKLTMQKLDKATEGLEDQGPLSVLGIVVGKLF